MWLFPAFPLATSIYGYSHLYKYPNSRSKPPFQFQLSRRRCYELLLNLKIITKIYTWEGSWHGRPLAAILETNTRNLAAIVEKRFTGRELTWKTVRRHLGKTIRNLAVILESFHRLTRVSTHKSFASEETVIHNATLYCMWTALSARKKP